MPHLTWPVLEGEVTPVYCYTDYPEAELFVNGKSQGRIKKVKEERGKWDSKDRLDRYRLRWNDVRYEPGELKVVVFDEMGNNCGQQVVKTAQKPARLQLDVWTQSSPDILNNQSSQNARSSRNMQSSLKADGQDMAFITISLLDRNGTLIPDAADQLRFEVEGAGTFRAVCNGDATSLEPFTQPTMKLFHGQLVVIVQAAKHKGTLTLKVTDNEHKLSSKVKIKVG